MSNSQYLCSFELTILYKVQCLLLVLDAIGASIP